jgi:hypothetical protein
MALKMLSLFYLITLLVVGAFIKWLSVFAVVVITSDPHVAGSLWRT